MLNLIVSTKIVPVLKTSVRLALLAVKVFAIILPVLPSSPIVALLVAKTLNVALFVLDILASSAVVATTL